MKKLYGQFTEDEKEMINTILQGINTKSVRITFHAKSRMKEKEISFRDLFGVFANYQIIELHEKDGDIRVLYTLDCNNYIDVDVSKLLKPYVN